jgi:hypothetical protein
MEPAQDDRSQDHGRKKNLYDVIIKNLLIGVRRVEGVFMSWWLSRCFMGRCLVGLFLKCATRGKVLFCVHVLAPSQGKTRISLESCGSVFTGSSLISKGSMFITKVPLSSQLIFYWNSLAGNNSSKMATPTTSADAATKRFCWRSAGIDCCWPA